MHFDDLTYLLKPRSVMVVGASDREKSLGRSALDNLLVTSNFTGPIYLVNSSKDTVSGRQCWRSVEEVPAGPIDVALVLVPAAHVVEALRACARRGVSFAVVCTSGFAEVGPEGQRVQAEMARLAQVSGMRIYGPNCPGLFNINQRVGLTISTEFKADLEGGPIALVTQGGGLGRGFFQTVRHFGVGVGLWCSTGNEADLEISDFLHHVARQPDLKVVALVAEGFGDGRRFMAAARAVAAAGKPIVILKIGRSDYGIKATVSHTASLAGSAAINSAVFRELGIIEVDDLDELAQTACLLSRLPANFGSKVCVYSFSGGASAFAADMIGLVGLELAVLQPETSRRLKEIAPSYAALDNPIDLSTDVFTRGDLNLLCLREVAADSGIHIILVPIPADYSSTTDQLANDLVAVQAANKDTLIVPVWMSERHSPGYEHLLQNGLQPLPSLRNATRILSRIVAWTKRPVDVRASSSDVAKSSGVRGLISEHEAKELLGARGISVPSGKLVKGADAAAQAAQKIGFPVVLKIVADGLTHKSEVGGVRLNVTTSGEARDAYTKMMGDVLRHRPNLKIDGILVESMTTANGLELLVGVHRDEVFGLVLSLGLGGIWVETLNDVAHRTLPLSDVQAAQMIEEIQAWPLLAGSRGRPRSDIDALKALLQKISDFAVAEEGSLEEMDLNPVWIGPEGSGVRILDAVVRFKDLDQGAL
jgi:acyl-CoA synthetase (NDP forming)